MKHKVLIATYYWPPSGGSGVQRFLKFCKYLPEFDIEPTVLTVSNPTYPIIDESLGEEVPEEVEVVKTRSYEPFQLYAAIAGHDTSEASKPTQALKSDDWKTQLATWIRANVFIPDARAGWLMSARGKALELVKSKNFDHIITTGPPHSTHFIGKYVKHKADIPWIADFRDPWSNIYYNQLLPRTPLIQKVDEKLERSVLKQADDVIVVSPSMEDIQKEFYDRSYHVIPNGFDPDDFEHLDQAARRDENNLFTIRFVGSVREAAIPEGLFKAISRLPDQAALKMEFIGNVHPKVGKLLKQYGIEDKVSFKSYMPHREAVKEMQTADLLLLSISKTENSELILTGKLFDYLGACTPILFMGTTTGDAANIVRETGQGVCYEHDDVEGIHKYLEQVLSDRSNLPDIDFNRDMRDHKYSRVTLTASLAEIINKT